jgi:hypothetical protein
MSKNIITVTLDLNKLRESARECKKDNGSLESSGGVTPDEMDMVWNGMKGLLYGNNDDFSNAVQMMINVLCEVESDEEEEDEG